MKSKNVILDIAKNSPDEYVLALVSGFADSINSVPPRTASDGRQILRRLVRTMPPQELERLVQMIDNVNAEVVRQFGNVSLKDWKPPLWRLSHD